MLRSVVFVSVVLLFIRCALSISEECHASSLINTSEDGVLPYPDMYFSSEQLTSHSNSSYPCVSFLKGSYANIASRRSVVRRSITIPLRHTCYPDLCPMHSSDVDASLSAMNWSVSAQALCALDQGVAKTVRVVVFGGSMTKALDIAGSCCHPSLGQPNCIREHSSQLRSDRYYCNWVGIYSRWLRSRFPLIDFQVLNLAQNGMASDMMAREATMYMSMLENMTLTSNDIVLLDHSCNDNYFINVDGIEMLVRQILLYAKTPPTIILMEQWMHGSNWTRRNEKPAPSDKFYIKHYRAVAQHYHLPIFSYYELIWSKGMRTRKKNLSDILTSYEFHAPWHAHMFIADALSGFTLRLLDRCKQEQEYRQPMRKLPLPISSMTQFTGTMCNATEPPIVVYAPTNPSRPRDLKKFERSLTGWTEFPDYHNLSGWIANKYVPAANKSMDFLLPDTLRNVPSTRNILIRIKYLRTYGNGGRAAVQICGSKLGIVNALFDYPSRKLSIPQFKVFTVSGEDLLRLCYAGSSSSVITVTHINAKDDGDPKQESKVKIFAVSVCFQADAI